MILFQSNLASQHTLILFASEWLLLKIKQKKQQMYHTFWIVLTGYKENKVTLDHYIMIHFNRRVNNGCIWCTKYKIKF